MPERQRGDIKITIRQNGTALLGTFILHTDRAIGAPSGGHGDGQTHGDAGSTDSGGRGNIPVHGDAGQDHGNGQGHGNGNGHGNGPSGNAAAGTT